MSSVVKHFHSLMTDAPVLNGVAGSFATLLDACLVNGFGLRTADSVTVSGGIATVTISVGHPLQVDMIALVGGASPSGLNGEKRVLSSTINSFTFAAPGVSDQTATGTISVKIAPLGWESVYSSGFLRVYRSPNVEGTRMFLRVDDSGTIDSRVVGYESMSDINTGVGAFPTAAQMSGGLFWPKANGANTNARAWTIVGDDRTFWFYANTHTTTAAHGLDGITYGFGDFTSKKSGDAYACAILGSNGSVGGITSALTTALAHSVEGFGTTFYAARSYTALGGSTAVAKRCESYGFGDFYSGTSNLAGAYPNAVDNSLILSRAIVSEATPQCIRGTLRGAYYVPQALAATTFGWLEKIDGQGTLAGKKLMALKGASPAQTAASNATVFMDITGPWG